MEKIVTPVFVLTAATNLASAYLEQGDKQLAEALLEHAYDHARAFPLIQQAACTS